MPVRALPGNGPVLLVVDNGWASAADWPRRMQAANTVLDRAERAGRQAALLATAPDETGAAPQVTAAMPVADLRARLAALHPEPWPLDRAAAAAALQAWHNPGGAIVYLGDGLTDGADFPRFAAALRDAGTVTELLLRQPPGAAAAAAPARGGSAGRRGRAAAAAARRQRRGAGAERRRPDPGARDDRAAAGATQRRSPDRAAARIAQPA